MEFEPDLRKQNEALNEQVKLLVRTEQRLTRSQNEIDRQLTRIELLSQFAMGWTAGTTPGEILSGAADLFKKLFRIDNLRIVSAPDAAVSPSSASTRTTFVTLEGDCHAWTALSAPVVAPREGLPRGVGEDIVRLGVCDGATPPGTICVVLPLRVNERPPQHFIVTASHPVTRSSHLREVPDPKNLPFLQLMAGHLEHMLRHTTLLQDLAATQQRLMHARDELEERVEARTRELLAEVTERRRAEQALIVARDAAEAASRAKSAFLANMSHELRTPLNAIIGYAELLAEETDAHAAPTVVEDLGRIVSAGRHLLRLVSDVLDLSKVEAGKMAIAHEAFDLADLVRNVVATARPLAEKNANRLEVSSLEALGSMHGDRTRVTQVLLNVLGNAAKFTEGGSIRMDVTREADAAGDHAVFRIADTGIGMAPDQLQCVFEDFTRANAISGGKYEGTGLGLAISRRLCRLMGGEIRAESTFGEGSAFTVILPTGTREGPRA